MRDFLKRNKETLIFCYSALMTLLFIIILLYAIAMSKMAEDLTSVVRMREQELEEINFDLNYVSAVSSELYSENEELFQSLTACELELDRKELGNER